MIRPILLAALLGTTPALAGSACDVPADLKFSVASLPHAASSIGAEHKLAIAAVGAGSTEGAAARDQSLAYPARLEARLRALLPGVAVDIANRGVPRETVEAMAQRIDRAVIPTHPALVIWEVGANDATQQSDPDQFADTLRAGIERLAAAGIDTILIDLQYAPSTESIVPVDRYEDAVLRVADLADVPVLRRYDIMRAWNETSRFDLDVTEPAEQTQTARGIYDCLAEQLATGIAAAVRH